MEKKQVLDLPNHLIYYVKTDVVNYYIAIPKNFTTTNICLEIKNKMDNYDLETNDEIWVMENVKTTYSYIDTYNITMVIPILSEENISVLEKIDDTKYEDIDKIFGFIINNAYSILKEENIKVDPQVILVDNDRYKSFINWFTTRYQSRISCKSLLELIRIFNANATAYKKLETPVINFVVGSYNTEVDAPTKVEKKEEILPKELKPQTSSGFTSYWLLLVITIVVATAVAFIAYNYK